MSGEVSAALRREVRERAHGCCEYCYMPDSEPLYPREPDHIRALKHGGITTSDNLAYACFVCNRAKGSDIASYDPVSDELTPNFNPRQQVWSKHFRFNGPLIEPLTATGRVTAFLLKHNLPSRVVTRDQLMQGGLYPVERR